MPGSRLLAALLLFSASWASAASKLDARLRAARSQAVALTAQGGPPAAQPQLRFLIQLSPGASRDALAARHPLLKISPALGGVVTVQGPASAIEALESDPDALRVEGDRRAHPSNDVMRSSSTSGALLLGTLKNGLGDLGTLDGTGVVIGVVDTGIDWTHNDFVDSGGNSRVLALWDQTVAGDATCPAPSGFGTGRECSQATLTANLGTAACLTAPPGVGCPVKSFDSNGHGSHVAGIAGGDGSEVGSGNPTTPGFYSGLAPKAQFIIVKTDFFNTSIINGVNYIIAKAASAAPGSPLVINLSLGENSGPHDGTDTFESPINAAAATTPITVAMGNDQLGNPHADAVFTSGASKTFKINNVSNFSPMSAEFWHPSVDHYTVTASVSCSASCPSSITRATGLSGTSSANGVTITLDNDTAGIGSDKQIYVQVDDPAHIVTNITVQMTNTALGSTGRVDGYTDPSLSGTQFTTVGAIGVTVDSNGTLTEPASSPNVISAAAFTSKKTWPSLAGQAVDNSVTLGSIASFSDRGPNRANVQKPEIAAPGEYIISVKSKDYSPTNINITAEGKHTDFHGTSQAAPAVCGAVALRLQMSPSATPAQIKAALEADGRTDAQTGGVPNTAWGYGKMLAPPLVQAAPGSLSVTGVGVSTVGFSWTLANNATSYNVYYSSNSFFIASVVSPLTYILPMTPNTQTGVNVCGVNATGKGPCAVSPSAVTLPSPIPGQPTYQVAVSSILVQYSPCPAGECSGYIFQASQNANFTGTVISSSTTNSLNTKLQFAQGSLTPNTVYFLRVGSLNSVGASSMTALGSTTTLTNVLVPGVAPQGPVAATSIQFNWSDGGNAPGTQYTASVSSVPSFTAGNTIFTQTGTDMLSAVFGGLLVDTSYFLRVHALLGPDLSSGPVSTLALPPAASPPTFSNVGTASLRAGWAAGSNPSGAIYLAQVSVSANFSTIDGSSQTKNLYADFAGLNANTTYYAQVLAISNGNVQTAPTALGSISTLALPLATAVPPFSNAFSTGFTANWTNPSDPPGTLFIAKISTSVDFTTVAGSSVTYNLFATFQSLIPNQTYYLAAAAINNNGVPSSTAPFFNPAAVSTVALPSAPAAAAFVGSTQTTTSLFVNWASGGNALPSRFLAQIADNAQFSAAASSTTSSLQAGFAGLATNTSYYARVSALNNDSTGPPSPSTLLGFASTLPNAPGAPASPFLSVTFTSVTVVWSGLPAAPPTATCEGYRVQASLDPGFGSIAASADFPFPATTGGVAGLASLTTYYVRVGAIGFDGSANFAVLGGTRTLPLVIAYGTMTVSGASVAIAPGNGSTLRSIQIRAAPGVFPLGTVISVSPSVATLPPPGSNQAAMAAMGSGVAFNLTAQGNQPDGLVTVVLDYDPMLLAPGVDARTMRLARYDDSGQWSLQQSFVDVADHLIVSQVGHFSLFSPFAVAAANDLDNVNIFPIPWEPTSSNQLFNASFLTISNTPPSSRVRVFTLSGERVWEGSTDASGVLTWPGNNSFGRIVGSGTYIVVIDGGGSRITKRAVIAR